MITALNLAGYPPVVSVDIDSPSDATPATVVIQCLTQFAGSHFPADTTLVISRDIPAVTVQWRLFAATPARNLVPRNGLLEIVFEDARKELQVHIMPRSFNLRGATGIIDTTAGAEKTIPELWQEIATLTGVAIVVRNARSFKPPAEWAGRTATEAANQLLRLTGSRMNYDPIAQEFVVDWAGNTASLGITTRTMPQSVSVAYSKLEVYSAPIIYDGTITCEAVWIGNDGRLQNLAELSGASSLSNVFLGYPGVANQPQRNRLVQASLRLWRPVANVRPLSHRGVVVAMKAGGPVWAGPRIAEGGEGGSSQYSQAGSAKSRQLRYDMEANLFIADNAVVVTTLEGVIQTSLDVIGGFYEPNASHVTGYTSITSDVNLQTLPIASIKRIAVQCVRPIISDQPDAVSGGSWQALLDAIRDAIAPFEGRLSSDGGFPDLVLPGNLGRVSRSRYRLDIGGKQRRMDSSFLFDCPSMEPVEVIGTIPHIPDITQACDTVSVRTAETLASTMPSCRPGEIGSHWFGKAVQAGTKPKNVAFDVNLYATPMPTVGPLNPSVMKYGGDDVKAKFVPLEDETVSTNQWLSGTRDEGGTLIPAPTPTTTKIFRSPYNGIPAAIYNEALDEITVKNEPCQEYVWNAELTKLVGLTTPGVATLMDPTPAPVPVTFFVANPFFGRLPAFICIPPGFNEGADVCEGTVPDVPELDPPCDTDVRNEVPYFFLGVKTGPYFIPTKPLIPTKRVHLLQRPQLVEDYLGNKELTFPLYEARIEAPLHDGCAPLLIAACGPPDAPIPCEESST